MGKTSIGWTNVVWNPVTGCSHVSPACDHCYAEKLSLRRGWSKKPWTMRNAKENVVLHPDRLGQPLHWRKQRRVFVNSMSDVFHEWIPLSFLDQIFAVMALSSRHTFQVLTKRAKPQLLYVHALKGEDGYDRLERVARAMGHTLRYEGIPLLRWPIPNVWLGVSVEDQRRADERIPQLVDTPAAVRWLSCEPLLGPIDIERALCTCPWLEDAKRTRHLLDCSADIRRPGQPRRWPIDWVVVGGQTGPGHCTMDLAWLEDLVHQCSRFSLPVFVKQDSGPLPGKQGRIADAVWSFKQFPRQ